MLSVDGASVTVATDTLPAHLERDRRTCCGGTSTDSVPTLAARGARSGGGAAAGAAAAQPGCADCRADRHVRRRDVAGGHRLPAPAPARRRRAWSVRSRASCCTGPRPTAAAPASRSHWSTPREHDAGRGSRARRARASGAPEPLAGRSTDLGLDGSGSRHRAGSRLRRAVARRAVSGGPGPRPPAAPVATTPPIGKAAEPVTPGPAATHGADREPPRARVGPWRPRRRRRLQPAAPPAPIAPAVQRCPAAAPAAPRRQRRPWPRRSLSSPRIDPLRRGPGGARRHADHRRGTPVTLRQGESPATSRCSSCCPQAVYVRRGGEVFALGEPR